MATTTVKAHRRNGKVVKAHTRKVNNFNGWKKISENTWQHTHTHRKVGYRYNSYTQKYDVYDVGGPKGDGYGFAVGENYGLLDFAGYSKKEAKKEIISWMKAHPRG